MIKDIKKLIENGKLAEMVAEASKGEQITDSKVLWNYLKPFFVAAGDNTVERFVCVFLDTKNRVISIETMATGTISSAAVYPREIMKRAFAIGAAAIIFAHNHPSGDPTPSREDKCLTRELFIACKSVGITPYEHIVIGGQSYFSFADVGLIDKYNRELNAFITS